MTAPSQLCLRKVKRVKQNAWRKMLLGKVLGGLARRQLRKKRSVLPLLSRKVKGALKTEFCPLNGASEAFFNLPRPSQGALPKNMLRAKKNVAVRANIFIANISRAKLFPRPIFQGALQNAFLPGRALQHRVTVLKSDLYAPPHAPHRS